MTDYDEPRAREFARPKMDMGDPQYLNRLSGLVAEESNDEYSLGRQLAALREELSMVDEAITLMAKRVGPITVDINEMSSSEKGQDEARDRHSLVVEDLIDLRAQVRYQHTRLMRLTQRIEI